MSDIVARALLFFAYASIFVATLGGFENSHSARLFPSPHPPLSKMTSASQFP
jgi:hypothetical protein